jgi:hypothetical protein
MRKKGGDVGGSQVTQVALLVEMEVLQDFPW